MRRSLTFLTVAAAFVLSGCYHADGRAFTGPEYREAVRKVWKFTLAGAREACDVVRGPLGSAAIVVIEGASVPILIARAACGVLDVAIPRDAVGVNVLADGTAQIVTD